MRKKGISKVLVRSVMSLYEGAKTRVRVDSVLSEELGVKVGIRKGSVLSHFLLAVLEDCVTEYARGCELLYADELVLMSETIEGLGNKFLKWMEALESKSLNVNLEKTKVVVSGGITKDGMSKSEVDPCRVYSRRAKANSVLFAQCG